MRRTTQSTKTILATAGLLAVACCGGGATFAAAAAAAEYVPPQTQWKVHDKEQPHPPVVTPATDGKAEKPAKPPADAVVLFGGADASKWQGKGEGGAATFEVEDGALVAAGGDVRTKERFGDVQLHLEWQIPEGDTGKGQDKGNSGVKLMGQYEVQILDSFGNANRTYADGIAGAVYGQHAPLVNASLPPGRWQTYDIVFTAPRRDADGKVVTPAYVTVLHNGVLVQDRAEIYGNTSGPARGYKRHGEKEPILLQFHGHAVRYRNIWARPLDAKPAAGATRAE